MTRKIIVGILIFGIIAIIGYFILMSNFEIFDEPIETELKVECDFESLRKIRMTEITGNATANRSIHIYATDCNYDENFEPELLFIASSGFIKREDVNFQWRNFDTLTVTYNEKLEIFHQKAETESLKPKIIIEYKAE